MANVDALQGPVRAPASGKAPTSAVVFAHGYGSNGDDLISLAPFFAHALPDAIFYSPNAPDPWEGGMMGGRQWYSLAGFDPEAIQRDPLRTFEFGVFYWPRLTRASSPYAPNWKRGQFCRGIGGASSIQFAITNSAIKSDKVALCVDFLRFVTAPRNLEPLVQEASMFIPNVAGCRANPLLQPFEVAFRAGFTDQLYFSRAFKRHFSEAPMAYRERVRGRGQA